MTQNIKTTVPGTFMLFRPLTWTRLAPKADPRQASRPYLLQRETAHSHPL